VVSEDMTGKYYDVGCSWSREFRLICRVSTGIIRRIWLVT